MTFVHLFSTGYFSFCILGFILRRHHYGLSASEAQQQTLVNAVSQMLEFPLMSLARFTFASAAISLTPLIWLANSLLWAFGIYTLAAFVTGKLRRVASSGKTCLSRREKGIEGH